MENEYGFLNYFNNIANIGSNLANTFGNLSNTDISSKISETKDRASSTISELFKDSKTKKLEEFQKAKDEYKPSEEQKLLGEREDAGAKPSEMITGEEAIKSESKRESDSLDKKLDDINKVIDKFSGDGGVKKLGGSGGFDASIDINPKPLNLNELFAKDYLTGVISKPSSTTSRVSLLLEDLAKLKLI